MMKCLLSIVLMTAAAASACTVWADIDVAGLRDPFVSQLPVQIVETSVEQRAPSGHNTGQARPASLTIASVPTAVPSASPPPVVLPHLDIQGIVWGGDRPMVLIDGSVLTAGSVIKDIKIQSIHRTGIDVVYKGKTFHANMDD